jgi:hypothetical protein
MSFQFLFALEEVNVMPPEHPGWKAKEPFVSLLNCDPKAALTGREKGMVEIIMATHAGMTVEEFDRIFKAWLTTGKHPKIRRPYTEMVNPPMLL